PTYYIPSLHDALPILIKPNISGIIEAVYVKAGENIKAGDPIAKIRVVANVSNLSNSQNQVQTAKIALDNQEKFYNRQKTLFDKGDRKSTRLNSSHVKI